MVWLMRGQYISTLESSEVGKHTPCGPHNSPPSNFCPHRWFLSNPAEGGFNESSAVSAIKKPTVKTGFHSFGSGMTVCQQGKDLAEVEILMVLSSTLCNV